MAENKTKPTDASVEDYLAARGSEQQRTDCRALMALLQQVTPRAVSARWSQKPSRPAS